MADPTIAYVGLGANLGDAQRLVRDAMRAIAALPQTQLRLCSSLYLSAPVEAQGPDFVNAVVELSTSLAPAELLKHLQAIEDAAGRQRPHRNAPRTLDLDILLYGDLRMNDAALVLPHPRMLRRAFVLIPLAEVAPRLVAPAQLDAVAAQRVQRL